MKLFIKIKTFELVPTFYGFVYYEPTTGTAVLSLMPFNHIFAFARKIWGFIRFNVSKSVYDKVYNLGYEMGMQDKEKQMIDLISYGK